MSDAKVDLDAIDALHKAAREAWDEAEREEERTLKPDLIQNAMDADAEFGDEMAEAWPGLAAELRALREVADAARTTVARSVAYPLNGPTTAALRAALAKVPT